MTDERTTLAQAQQERHMSARREGYTASLLDAWHKDYALTPSEMATKCAGLLVLWRAPDGAAMHTARDDGDSWWVSDWETCDMDGEVSWRTTGGYRMDKAVVQRLAQAQESL
jgi:hypothetical protein